MWFDEINKIGILEPVGTDSDYRKMGLGKAAVFEGIKRIRKQGAKEILVGSDQQFYKSIGFVPYGKRDIYTKVF